MDHLIYVYVFPKLTKWTKMDEKYFKFPLFSSLPFFVVKQRRSQKTTLAVKKMCEKTKKALYIMEKETNFSMGTEKEFFFSNFHTYLPKIFIG